MRIGLVHNWPGSKNSELDLIQRICQVLSSLGHEGVMIDPFGNVLKLDTGAHYMPDERPRLGTLDFYLNLHYLNPKLLDFYSYVVNWNPLDYILLNPTDGSENSPWHIEFIHDSLLSHDYILSASSSAMDHYRDCQYSLSRWAPHHGELSMHATCQIFDDLPSIDLAEFRVFYIGANWERAAKANNPQAKIRHEGLLERLDRTGDFEFYGVREQMGVFLWEGFRHYRGELPFDAGKSIVEACNKAGVALVLSSDAHRESGVVSTRIFQACAARAVVICDNNPFVERFFGDTVLTFEYATDTETTFLNILEKVAWIRGHQQEASKMANAAHEIFRTNFSLDAELSRLIDVHPANLAARTSRRISVSDYSVDIYFLCPKSEINAIPRLMRQVAQQDHTKLRVIVVVPASMSTLAENLVAGEVGHAVDIVIDGVAEFDRKFGGQLFLHAFETHGNAEFFAIWSSDIVWHSMHFSNCVVDAYESGCQVVQAGTFVHNRFLDGQPHDCYFAIHSIGSVPRVEAASLMELNLDRYQPSAFLFNSKPLYTYVNETKQLTFLDTGFYYVFLLLLYLREGTLPSYVPKFTCQYVMPEKSENYSVTAPSADAFFMELYNEESRHSKYVEATLLHSVMKHDPDYWCASTAYGGRWIGRESIVPTDHIGDARSVAEPFSLNSYMSHMLGNRPMLLRIWGWWFKVAKRLLKLP